jgi:IS1 family transposase
MDECNFYSDGNDDYTYVLPLYFNDLDYGQLVKKREKGRVVDKEKRIIHGSPDMEGLETTSIEGFNSILRERVGRLARKTKC